MSKRPSTTNVNSLQHGLALEAALGTKEGMAAALELMTNPNNVAMRSQIQDMKYVVAPREAIEELFEQLFKTKKHSYQNAPDLDQKAKILKDIRDGCEAYHRAGMSMPTKAKKDLFEAVCVSTANYGYHSSRYNLMNGMVNRGDREMHIPDPKEKVSYHTYYGGRQGIEWAVEVLHALGLPEGELKISVVTRTLAVKWRPDLKDDQSAEEDSDDE